MRQGASEAGRAVAKASRAIPTPMPLPVGSPRCRCGACGEHFTSVSGFDRHQRLADDGSVICRHPDAVGLVQSAGWWSFPPDPRYAKD